MSKLQKITGFTLSRKDLVEFSRALARAVPEQMLDDQKHPLIIGIKGSFNCGKKCIVDSFIEAAIDIAPCPLEGAGGWSPENKDAYRDYLGARIARGYKFDGLNGRNEHIVGRHANGHMISLDYLDLNYHPRFFSFGGQLNLPDDFVTSDDAVDYCLRQREYGGVMLLQNTEDLYDLRPDVEIWLENEHQNFQGDARRCPDLKQKMRDDFDGAASPYDWGRYVEVQVNNPAYASLAEAAQLVLKQPKVGGA